MNENASAFIQTSVIPHRPRAAIGKHWRFSANLNTQKNGTKVVFGGVVNKGRFICHIDPHHSIDLFPSQYLQMLKLKVMKLAPFCDQTVVLY